MPRTKDLTGQQFGRLTAIRSIGLDKWNNVIWECKCECGNTHATRASQLLSGRIKSCGCSHTICKKTRKRSNVNLRLYSVWKNMKARCLNPNCSEYRNYGARGIAICDEWIHDFNTFKEWAYKSGYDENAPRFTCTIDRIDVNGNYEPENCRWTTMKVQNMNKRPREQWNINKATKNNKLPGKEKLS